MSLILTEPVPSGFRKQGLGWAYSTEDGLTLSVDWIKRRGDELHGVLTITSQRPGESEHVHKAGHNFTGFQARSTLAKHLATRIPEVNWGTLLEQFCVGVMNRQEAGYPVIQIGNRPPDEAVIDWMVDKLIPAKAITWVYGARASCKSQLMAALTVSLTYGTPFLDRETTPARVMIFDWEDHDYTWEAFIRSICLGQRYAEVPDIPYRRCTIPVVRQLNTLARMIDDEGADFVIMDSFGGAGGPVSEHGSYEEVALNTCAAIKELDTTVVMIDHISQASRINTRLPADPVGSQQKLAQARAGYEVRMEKTPGAQTGHLGLFDRKHQMQRPMGILATWLDGALTFELEDLLGSGTQMALDSVSAGDRLMWQLRRGRLAIDEIGERLGVTPQTAKKLLLKGRALGKIVEHPDDTWGVSPSATYGDGRAVQEAS